MSVVNTSEVAEQVDFLAKEIRGYRTLLASPDLPPNVADALNDGLGVDSRRQSLAVNMLAAISAWVEDGGLEPTRQTADKTIVDYLKQLAGDVGLAATDFEAPSLLSDNLSIDVV